MAAGAEWERFAEEPLLPAQEHDETWADMDAKPAAVPGTGTGADAGREPAHGAEGTVGDDHPSIPDGALGEEDVREVDGTGRDSVADEAAPASAADAATEALPGAAADEGLSLAELTVEVRGLRGELRRLADLTTQQGTFVDKLHADNERLRRAEADRLRDPLVRELIAVADTQLRNARRWDAKQEPGAVLVAEALRGVAGDVQLLLDRQGVESYLPSAGERFDRKQHRARGTAETSRSELEDTVAEVVLPGYRIGDRTVRPAEVVVWRFTQAPETVVPTDGPADSPKRPGTDAVPDESRVDTSDGYGEAAADQRAPS